MHHAIYGEPFENYRYFKYKQGEKREAIQVFNGAVIYSYVKNSRT
jgi:hypothetical protein